MDVFISYAHEDTEFVGRLHAALSARGREAWVDTEGIEPADRWRGSAQEAIERSDAFVFVLSRASLASRACLEELDYAVSVNKQLIAISVEEAVADVPKPSALDELSWIMVRPEDDFEQGVDRLVRALDTDLEVVRTHTRILVRARAWELANRRPSPLLRGDELAAAEEWLSRVSVGGGPQPTELQREFVLASRRAATRRQRTIAGVSMLVATIAVGLSIFALIERSDAVDNQRIAQSRLLTVEAEANISADASLSTLLALEALHIHYTGQAEQALRDALANLQTLLILGGHTSAVDDAVYSPDGTRIATCSSEDGTVRIYDAHTGAQQLVIPVSTARVAFSPDGRRIVTSGPGGGAAVWDARTGKMVLRAGGRREGVLSVSFSMGGARILTGEAKGDARVFDARTGAQQLVIHGHLEVLSAAFSPDGSRIAVARLDGTTHIYDARTGAPQLVLRTAYVSDAQFSPDGSRIVTAEGSPQPTTVWDARTGRRLEALVDPLSGAASANTASFSLDGREILTGAATADIWDASTGRHVNVLGNPSNGTVLRAAFSPDGGRVVTGDSDHYARVWNAKAGNELLAIRNATDNLAAGGFSPDATRLVTATGSGLVQIWVAATGTQLMQFQAPDFPLQGVGYSPDGTRILTTASPGTVRVWDARTGRQLLALGGGALIVSHAAFTPDGARILAVGNQSVIWDARTGRRLLSPRYHAPQSPNDAEFSPDGSRFVTAGSDGTVRVYDARTGAQRLALTGNTSAVNSASFSADGSKVVSAGADGTARVWDARTGRQLLILVGHTAAVDSAAFSRDGALIATGADDDTVRIWNARSGAQLLVFSGDTFPKKHVEFNPSGSEVLSVSASAWIWSTQLAAPVPQLERIARSLVTRTFTAHERARYLAGISG